MVFIGRIKNDRKVKMIKLTQNEADKLISMLKRKIIDEQINFPNRKEKISFDVLGERRTDEFVVNIERKGINAQGCTYQGRIKSNNIILMRLDVNPTAVHINLKDGSKIEGSHIHIYDEEWETRYAIPFDVEGKDLFEICYSFFEKFNVIEPPTIIYQEKLEGFEV